MGLFDFFKKNKQEKEENNIEVQAVSEEAVSEELVSEELVSEEIVSEETIADEPVSEEFTVEEPIEEEPIVEETIIEEPTIEKPTIEEAPIEKNVSEEIVSEEPVAEETTEEEAIEEAIEEVVEEEPVKQSFFAKIKTGLQKTRDNIMSGVENVLKGFTTIDEDLYEELEEALIMADIGVQTSTEIIDRLRERVKADKVHEVSEVKELIVSIISDILKEGKSELVLTSPSVILVIGVNGVGKTTTIGKLASYYKAQGKSVVLAAADTFRAAAIDQLEVWGERNGVPVIKHQENSDPGAVVFDAVQSAKAKNTDILICDTAGRLHNKKNLMDELAKIFKIISREYPQAQQEVFLVLDATTGQNALQQAKLFKEAADITGLVLTKLDGTAKGGVVIAIKNELKLPVRFIGVGEAVEDLQPFDEDEFARALFEN